GRESYAALGQAAFDMAQLTGKSAAEAASATTQMFDGTAAGALKANEQYHFLTDATYDHIKALQEEGRAQEAAQVAAEAFHDAVGPRIAEMESQVYGLARAWDSVAASTKGWWEEFKTGAALIAGTADITTQYYAQLGRVQGEIEHFGSASFGQQEKLDQLKAQMDAAVARTDQQASQTRLNNDAVTGSATIDRLSASVDKADAKKQKLAELSAAFDKLWGSASPDNARLAGVQRLVGADGSVSFSGGAYDKLRADIEKKYAPPKGPKSHEPAAYATFVNQVDALGIKNITADDAAVTKYQQGIAKLAEDMGNYMAKGGDATRAAAEFNRGQKALQETLDANHARELAAQNQYAAALDKSNAALQQQVNNEIARIGMGDKEYQRSQAITKAYQEEADALEKLSLKRQAGINGESGGLSQASYDADVKALRAATAEKVSIMQDGYVQMDAAQADWQNGLSSALQNYVDEVANVAEQSNRLFTNAFGGMGDALANFVTTGKGGFSGLVDSIIKDLVRMEARILVSQVLQSVLGAFMGSYGAEGTNTYSSIGTDSSGGSINFVSQVGGRAGGGRIDGPGTGTSDSILARVSTGENVITASATDYYGQSFMDAINAKQLPRYADGGRVGGGGGGGGMGAPEVVVNITNNGQAVQAQQTGARMDGQKMIIDLVLQAVQGDIAKGGGTAQAMQQRFGLTRRGVPVGG
ncbi:phage tail tape measure protein, partial [Rhodanobacter denitrificans]|nr:phage tail tape measure protein [Rhodanobacter denitrificans]